MNSDDLFCLQKTYVEVIITSILSSLSWRWL